MPDTLARSDDLRSTLADVSAWLRTDLQIRRQVSRGESFYVVHDPVSFASHRLTRWQYRIAILLSENLPLRDVFATAVATGLLADEDEVRFYQLIRGLYEKTDHRVASAQLGTLRPSQRIAIAIAEGQLDGHVPIPQDSSRQS